MRLLGTYRLNCSIFSGTIRNAAFEMPLGQAWKTLKNIVIAGDFKIQVNMNGNVSKIIS